MLFTLKKLHYTNIQFSVKQKIMQQIRSVAVFRLHKFDVKRQKYRDFLQLKI